jgi:hypothetical protein
MPQAEHLFLFEGNTRSRIAGIVARIAHAVEPALQPFPVSQLPTVGAGSINHRAFAGGFLRASLRTIPLEES